MQTSTSESFYGHEQIAKLCARFISHLFSCPEVPPPSSSTTPSLPYFIAYALHRTHLHPSVTYTSLLLLQRLKARFPTAKGASGHRLFIAAFMIASKVICDDTYSNKSWTIVCQDLFALREINIMEREMCTYLDWSLDVDMKEVQAFQTTLEQDPHFADSDGFLARVAALRTSSSPTSSDFPATPMKGGSVTHSRRPSSPDTPDTLVSDGSGFLSNTTSPEPITPPKDVEQFSVQVVSLDDREPSDPLQGSAGCSYLMDVKSSPPNLVSPPSRSHSPVGMLELMGICTAIVPPRTNIFIPFPSDIDYLYDQFIYASDVSLDIEDAYTVPDAPRLPPIPLPMSPLSALRGLSHLPFFY